MRNPSPTSVSAATRRFDRFELRPSERVLLADGAPINLGARAFDVLVALSDRPGVLVSKDELLAAVWSGLVVEENNLQVQVSTLRKILGPDAVATIPGRGYRFNVPVIGADGEVAPPAGEHLLSVVPASPARIRSNLPARLPALYGRSQDLQAIVALTRQYAVVTITGPGGIGKTRVAQAVAQQVATERASDYPDGIWWVELGALNDSTLVDSAVAQAMGRSPAGDRDGPSTLCAQLSTQRSLIVLDNCEHLADAVAEWVEAIVAAAPGVSLLITSQETLKVADEQVYRLGPLAVPDDGSTAEAARTGAVELFEARAHAVDRHFSLDGSNRRAVIEICRRLDGIPLAIELAAARLPLLGVEGLRARLHERFSLLTAGSRVVLRRHQTLRATLEWSHALLTHDEQTVFRRLGVFSGGFTLEAAQQLASDATIDRWAALDHLGALVDKSLVLPEGEVIPRYRMLESTRAFALERLAEAGETQATLGRHARAIVRLLEPFEIDDWQWRASGDRIPAAAAELDNLRAALEWADAAEGMGALAVELASLSYCVWWSSSHMAEGLTRALALQRHVARGIPKEIEARFWLTIAKLALYSFRREGRDAAVRAVDLYRELGNAQRLYDALLFAAVEGTRFATPAQMEAAIVEAERLERPEWPARQRAKVPFARCWWFARTGRFEEALQCAQRQVAICQEAGVEIAALYAMSNVAMMEVLLGREAEALDHARAAIARLHAIGHDAGAGHLYHGEMSALLMLDRLDEARVAGRHAYERLLREGDEYRLLQSLALMNALDGKIEIAARLLGFFDALQARSGENDSAEASLVEQRLAPLLAALPEHARARLALEGAALSDEEAFRIAFDDGK